MSAPDRPKPQRAPFEGWASPPPFYRTPEFGRFLWLAGLLVFIGVFGFLGARTKAKQAQPETEATTTATAASPHASESPEERTRRISSAFEGALNDTRNGEDFGETSGFHQLVRMVSGYDAEDFHAQARTLDYAAALADPDAWRGVLVRVRGIVAGMHAAKLQPPVRGITDVYRGFLTDSEGERGIAFDLVEYPPTFEMRREAVDVEGVFYRTVRYENEAGKVIEVPYLMARNLALVSKDPSVSRSLLGDHAGTLLIASALAILVIRLVMYAIQRNRGRRRPIRPPSASLREMMETRLREHGGQVPGGSPTDPPST